MMYKHEFLPSAVKCMYMKHAEALFFFDFGILKTSTDILLVLMLNSYTIKVEISTGINVHILKHTVHIVLRNLTLPPK